MSTISSSFKSAKFWCACAVAAVGLGTAQFALAAPMDNWTQPYNAGNSPDSPLLFNFNESSGSVGTNEGTAGSANNAAYSGKNASNNVASGAGIPATGFGNALKLDGTNSFTAPGVNSGNISATGYAIEAWFKLDSVPGGDGYGYIVNDYNPGNPAGGYPEGRHYTLSIHNSGGNAFLDFAGVRADGNWVAFTADDVPVSVGGWHHALVQYVPGTRWEMYLDGVLKKTQTNAGWGWTEPTTPTEVNIGSYLGSYLDFHGEIDSVRISNTSYEVAPVPEPVSLSLLALGGLGFLSRRRS